MQSINTYNTGIGLNVGDEITTGDVNIATGLTTGALTIGNSALASISVSGAPFMPRVTTYTDVVKLSSTSNQDIINQTTSLYCVQFGQALFFHLTVDYDDTDEWNGNPASVKAQFHHFPFTASHFLTSTMLWEGPNPFINSIKGDTFAIATNIGVTTLCIHDYTLDDHEVETNSFKNQAGKLNVSGFTFIQL